MTLEKIVITLPGSMPTLNKIVGQPWYAVTKLKTRTNKAIYHNLLEQRLWPIRRPYGKATISAVRYGMKAPDMDNLIGGLKFIIDGLRPFPRGANIITDDDPDHLHWGEIRFEKVAIVKDCRTVITITPLAIAQE